jgi:hypothetical protein
VVDPDLKRYLKYSLDKIRERSSKEGITEIEELKQLHTCFTPGALDWDLWVSAVYKPEDAYLAGAKSSTGAVYGDFLDLNKGYIEGVMVLDVPESEIVRYSGEAGIKIMIKQEWIRAIVPQHRESLEDNIKKVESLL